MQVAKSRPMWTVSVSGSAEDFQLAIRLANAKIFRPGAVRTWIGSHIGDDGVTRSMLIRSTGVAADGIVRWSESVLGVSGPV